jgi:hypothetical protein
MTANAGVMPSEEIVGNGSPIPEAGAPTSSMAGEVVVGSLVASTGPSAGTSTPQPQMGAATTSEVAGDDPVEEPEVVSGHPFLRASWDVSLDEVMGTTHRELHQA